MGRIWVHNKYNKDIKTYSKVTLNITKDQTTKEFNRNTRKPLPKFEDLFLEMKEDSFFSKLHHGKPQRILSDDSISSKNDTFDAVANLKIDEINVSPKKKTNMKISSNSSSSECSENDNFLSACHSLSEEMFLIHKENSQVKERKASVNNKTESPVSKEKLAAKNEGLLPKYKEAREVDTQATVGENKGSSIPHLSVTPLVFTPKDRSWIRKVSESASKMLPKDNAISRNMTLLNPAVNMLTSTPSATVQSGLQESNHKILHSDLSPVTKERSQILESSYCSELNSLFASCNVNDWEFSLRNSKISIQNSQVQDDSLLKNQFHSKLQTNHDQNNIYLFAVNKISSCMSPDIFDLSNKSKTNEINHSNTSLFTSFTSFRRITRRRRIAPQLFKFRHRKRTLISSTKFSIGNVSCNQTFSPEFNKKASHICVDRMESSHIHSCRDDSELSAHTFTIKPGKGWRRSVHMKLMSISPHLGGSVLQDLIRGQGRSSLRCFPEVDIKDKNPRKHVLDICNQNEELPLTSCFTERLLENCKKIGEGLYGEVFIAERESSESVVLKMIPIEGDFTVNGEPQKTFEEILAELVVSKALSDLRDNPVYKTSSFVHLHRCWCVKGSYPSKLLQLWDDYAENKGSDNDRPSLFPHSQLSIILEFSYAGQNLESFVFNNATQAYAAFVQIAFALAMAEEALEFEHRDLHWGNVLINPSTDSYIIYKIKEHDFRIKTQGIRATIIDFTLSRLVFDGRTFFNDLSKDPDLFAGNGDYQFEVYRMMQRKNSFASGMWWLRFS